MRDADIAIGHHRGLPQRSGDDGQGRRVVGEGLPTEDHVIGVEDVGDQRHRTAEYLGSLLEQGAGGRVTAAGQSQHPLDVVDRQIQRLRRLDDTRIRHGGLEPTGPVRVEKRGTRRREVPDHRRPSGRGVHGAVDAEGDPDHLAGVEVQEARPLIGIGTAGVHDELGGGHGLYMRRHRHRQPHRLGDDLPDRSVLPAQAWVVDESARRHPTADGDAGPEDATSGPAAEKALGALADCGEGLFRGVGDRGGDLDRADHAVEQIMRGDGGDLVTDVDAQGQERRDVEFEGQSRPPDGAGRCEIGAFTQQSGLEQCADLAVDRRDGQSGEFGGFVPEHRARESGGTQHQRRGLGGEFELRGRYVDASTPLAQRPRIDPGGTTGDRTGPDDARRGGRRNGGAGAVVDRCGHE